jgi:hypothetical protein
MADKYTIFRELDNGEMLAVVKFDDPGEAREFMARLASHWPAHYFVRGPRGESYEVAETLAHMFGPGPAPHRPEAESYKV